ncbi:MAG: DUF4230 domain-containing protein [Oscillospiraceae bacterium]|nr:DUF4230 domain-containing protein [Oscillospiraceae bacterium]
MRKRDRILIGTGAILILLAVIIGVTWMARHETATDPKGKNERESATSASTGEGKIFLKDITLSRETIQSGLREIGKLCTAEYDFTHVETFESQKDLFGLKIPGTKASYVYSYDGTIMAGVDFTRISVEKDDAKMRITIHFPKVEIISSEIDMDSFTLYGEKKSIFNPFEVEDFALTQSDMIRMELEKAVEDGILDRAAENAEQILINFLTGTFDLDRYEIRVTFAK